MTANRTILVFLSLILNASTLYSQTDKVAIIDYYGRGYSISESLPCLPFREMDTIKFIDDDQAYLKAVTAMESCLKKIPSIRQAEVSFVCCTQPGDQWMAYIGMDTAAAPPKAKSKTAAILLPEETGKKYERLMNLLTEAVEHNEAEEEYTNGHTLIKYEPAQKIQKEFVTYANANLKLLRSVLHTSKFSGEREIAAYIIAYYPNKKEIVGDLLDAVSDPEAEVRNNAMRGIGVIADWANYYPELDIRIDAAPFIKLMNSISWTDRNKSSLVLLGLTQNRNQQILGELKAKALKSITDMAGWKNFGHSLPGYLLLGRIINWPDEVILSGVNNERKAQIEEMLKAMK